MIESMFATGHIADLVLAVMVIEAGAIYVLMRRGRIQLAFRTYLSGVIAGGFIVLALRQALTGGSAASIALALACSFLAHIAELFSFLQRKNGNPNHVSSSYNLRSDHRT